MVSRYFILLKLLNMKRAFAVAFIAVLIPIVSIGADQAETLQFFTNKAEAAARVLADRFPAVTVFANRTNLGPTSFLIGCRKGEGSAIKTALEQTIGAQSIEDWLNLTPHEWKSAEGAKLADLAFPPHKLKALDHEHLETLTAGQRLAVIEDLEYFLSNRWTSRKSFKESEVHQAVRALGYLKSSGSIDLLTKHLTYKPQDLVVDPDLPPQLSFPSAVALARIGVSTRQKMLEIIAASTDGEARSLATWVLFHANSADLPMSVQQLEGYKLVSPTSGANLEEAAKALRKFVESSEDPSSLEGGN